MLSCWELRRPIASKSPSCQDTVFFMPPAHLCHKYNWNIFECGIKLPIERTNQRTSKFHIMQEGYSTRTSIAGELQK